MGVWVRALNVRPQLLQRNRKSPCERPQPMISAELLHHRAHFIRARSMITFSDLSCVDAGSVSKPSISGIKTSRMITSGLSPVVTVSSASLPF